MSHHQLYLLLVLFTLLGPYLGHSQNMQRQYAPDVQPDGRVTFHFVAPHAEKVLLAREGTLPTPMQQADSGVWTYTTAPLPPDIYAYSYVVDGNMLSDPTNPMTKPFAMSSAQSLVHVPGPDSLSWEINDVPRGVLHRHFYASDAVGEERSFLVYTPPGYNPTADQTYPVLYLLHGVMDNEDAWTAAGRAHIILDNLIARGQAEPMLLVFPQGYGFSDVPNRMGELFQPNTNQKQLMDVFGGMLIDEIIPHVEAAYAVGTDRKARALAGLSMGGAQAVYIGLNQSDRFGWLGSFSGAFMMYGSAYDALFPRLNTANMTPPHLLWIGSGTEDFVIGINRTYTQWLTSKDISFSYHESEGGHTWMVWRRYLTSFVPLLFQSDTE